MSQRDKVILAATSSDQMEYITSTITCNRRGTGIVANNNQIVVEYLTIYYIIVSRYLLLVVEMV